MDYVRSIVSGKKIRYLEDGFNLDLSYITPRIIAMSLPGEGLHKIYRNSISDVAKFLNKKHCGCYLVLNLSGIRYDYEKFRGNVIDFEWVDHYPPQVEVLFAACKSMHGFLAKDQRNVIVVNCKAGKGRTGTLICCYLMYCGRFSDWKQATSYYRSKRFIRGGGVTQPSQLRYIQYFTQIFQGWVKYPLVTFLSRIQIRTAPHLAGNSSKLLLKIYQGQAKVYSNKRKERDQQLTFHDTWEDLTVHELVQFSSALLLCGEVTITLQHWGLVSKKNICRFTFNTSFIPIENEIKVEKIELDPDNFKHSKKVSDRFYIHLFFSKLCNCTVNLAFEDRCDLCRDKLAEEQREKWDLIHKVMQEKIECKADQALFAGFDDDVDKVLARVVDECGFSSDGSNY